MLLAADKRFSHIIPMKSGSLCNFRIGSDEENELRLRRKEGPSATVRLEVPTWMQIP